jgi:hypothetical protein
MGSEPSGMMKDCHSEEAACHWRKAVPSPAYPRQARLPQAGFVQDDSLLFFLHPATGRAEVRSGSREPGALSGARLGEATKLCAILPFGWEQLGRRRQRT